MKSLKIEISWRSGFSYLATSMVCIGGSRGSLLWLQIPDVGGMSFRFVAMFSPCRSLSNPLEVDGHWGPHPTDIPPDALVFIVVKLRMWDTTSVKPTCFVGVFFGVRVSLSFRLQLESLLYLLCCGALRMMRSL